MQHPILLATAALVYVIGAIATTLMVDWSRGPKWYSNLIQTGFIAIWPAMWAIALYRFNRDGRA